MIDELDLFRTDMALQRLLGHYAEAGATQPEAWQDRVMHLEGVEPRDLTRLHGQLIAFGWVDQNTGQTPVLKPGVVACCYRATRDGLRILKQVRAAYDAERSRTGPAAVEGKVESPRKSKKAKKGNPAVEEPSILPQANHSPLSL
jgi:hypothetical protein